MFELLLTIVSMFVFFIMFMIDPKGASKAKESANEIIKEWKSE